ncbi:hypothetical protein [Mesonia sp. K4-1]|uniref:hypothetical protein n=1 Tax=Mesonia sp. K4-1 TaxID=2602760 RepID=UPI0011C97C4D|nr:hypothetical protein [Mesonia sp. K4-1]TXK74885.1 hypothetical protein FT986_10280 [Mesonia sp. K4-1]
MAIVEKDFKKNWIQWLSVRLLRCPYIEAKQEHENQCSVQEEPFSIGFILENYNPDFLDCRLRYLNENEIDTDSYNALTKRCFYHQVILLDITHALYGFDVLFNGGVDSLPDIYY